MLKNKLVVSLLVSSGELCEVGGFSLFPGSTEPALHSGPQGRQEGGGGGSTVLSQVLHSRLSALVGGS